MNASIAPVGVVRIASIIPKHAYLCSLLSLFLVLAIKTMEKLLYVIEALKVS